MSNSPVLGDTRQRLRAAMPVAQKWAYFDHAAVAPLSEPASLEIRQWLDEATHEGDTVWPRWAKKLAAARKTAARVIGAEPEEIALVANTTAGINFVAEGLDWRSGDNVVTLDDEFPSNLYPWMHLAHRGVETRLAATDRGRVDVETLAARCDRRTRLITVSWVGYKTGCRRDLDAIAEVAQSCGALLLVDAIQGVGAFPIDVGKTPIDFLAADGHKWQLGPEGAGFAFVRRDRLPLLRTVGVGWNSVQQGSDFDHIELSLRQDARRYEGGSQNMAGLIGWGASLDLLDSLGMENVAALILQITDAACERLSEIGADIVSPREAGERSGIVTFEMPGADAMQLRNCCAREGVALACRGGRLRISPHAYNNEEDLDRLIRALTSA